MISRCALNGEVVKLCEASDGRRLRVVLWNMPEVRDDVPGSAAFVSTMPDMATPNYGTPIPHNGWPFTFWLEPGEVLWAMALDEALLGLSTVGTE